jgi:hypothetical protein
MVPVEYKDNKESLTGVESQVKGLLMPWGGFKSVESQKF